jgi:hypothetical protein
VGDDSATVEMLRRAHHATLEASTARVVAVTDHEWPPVEPTPRRRPRSRPVRLLSSIAKASAKRLWTPITDRFRHMEAEGVIDFGHRRYAVDYGYYSLVYLDGQEWSGRSGRARLTLSARSDVVPTPLWLVDLLSGVTHADDSGTDIVRGGTCRRIAARVDVGQASAATPGGVAAPALTRFEGLLSLPVDVWIDDTHVRRVRCTADHKTDTIELWDFGVRIKALDWTYMPTFRSPDAGPRNP